MGKGMYFDRWRRNLVEICGVFAGLVQVKQNAVSGCTMSRDLDGPVVADAFGDAFGDAKVAIRNLNEIQGDDADHIYCLIQFSGHFKAEHIRQRSLLGTGE